MVLEIAASGSLLRLPGNEQNCGTSVASFWFAEMEQLSG